MRGVLRVPGKVMLSGEFAVLAGGRSLSFTINSYLTLSYQTSSDPVLCSNLWISPKPLRQFLKESSDIWAYVLRQMASRSKLSLNLTIESELDLTYGFGSSSALTLATLMAYLRLPALEAAPLAWNLQREYQGSASGYDVATQTLGGIVEFQQAWEDWPQGCFVRHNFKDFEEWVHIFVGGSGCSTSNAASAWKLQGQVYKQALREHSEELTGAFLDVCSNPSLEAWQRCYPHIGKWRRFLANPQNDPKVVEDLTRDSNLDKTWSFKLTGAGGGDALLCFGPLEAIPHEIMHKHGWRHFAYQVESYGAVELKL